ncbi:MAG: hypothetical protein M3480_05530 [Verrucomicrobiota bacterium]|nr:hypothetical protein [Chthoniobacterales bacterium]MDQ3414423.1 hypothetical protein [Verrucomicrobiota bacterium]
MKRTKATRLVTCLIAPLFFGACEPGSRYETETAVPASTGARTRVLKDEIPAEGQRKIPVIEEY